MEPMENKVKQSHSERNITVLATEQSNSHKAEGTLPMKKRRRFLAISCKEDEKMNPEELIVAKDATDERKEKMTGQSQLTTTFCSNFDKTSDVNGFLIPSKTKLVLDKEDKRKEIGDVANEDQMTMIKWGITKRRSKVNGESTNSKGNKEERKYCVEGSCKDDDLYTKVKKGRMVNTMMSSGTEGLSGRECTRVRFHGKGCSFRVPTHDRHSLDETTHPHERKKGAIKRKRRKTRSIYELLQDKRTIPPPPAEVIQESSLLDPIASLLISLREK